MTDRYEDMTPDGTGTVGTTQAQALPRRPGRGKLRIENTHGSNVLYVGSDANVTSSAYSEAVAAGEKINLDGYVGPVHVVGSGAGTTYVVTEVYTDLT